MEQKLKEIHEDPGPQQADGQEANIETGDDVVDSRPTKHEVSGRETLNSIAAMYDITPSELGQINKIPLSRTIFTGQILTIPPAPPPRPPPRTSTPPPVEEDIIEYQFIKMRVRHITCDHGVVWGSILLTPNAVIFDPDPKDLLVKENEPEAFQVIAPMEFVVNSSIFYDFFTIGNTKGTMGKENPPSQIYTRPPSPKLDKDNATEKKDESVDNDISPDSDASADVVSVIDASAQSSLQDSQPDLKKDPFYLRLTMGKPVGKEVALSTPIMAYGMQTMMPEYWFIIPSKQVPNLYKFLINWFPEFYGSFDLEEIHEMGFELVPEPEVEKDSEDIDGQEQSCPRPERNIFRKTMTMASIDMDGWLPETDVKSELLSDDQRKLLHQHLPPRTQGYQWNLVFSTQQHGFSLHSLYRKSAEIDSPVLMVIQDTDHATFGAFISCPPAISEKFRGTGESWLFSFFPVFKVYKWTGENNYFVQGSSSSLVVGSSEGQFGLWLDENFNQGASQAVSTFDNKPLPGKEDFVINNVECWTFV